MVKNLRLLREKHGLSQQSLAEKLGITQQAVYKYEKTSVEPDISTLMQLARLFKATPHKDHFLDFAHVLLASFPSYCTIRPSKATALRRPRCTI